MLYNLVGEFENVSHYNEKLLAISRNIGARQLIGISYLKMGYKFYSPIKYHMANKYNKKAFVIFKDIREREGLASFYLNQGNVELAVGNSNKAEQYFENALAISNETGNMVTEVSGNLCLGDFFFG